jgi:general secretion pathway protein E
MDTVPEKISLEWLCEKLVASGQLSLKQAQDVRLRLSRANSAEHPLTRIANLKLARADKSGHILDAEILTQWLATLCHMDYRKIDPLQVDISKATAVCAYAYAARVRILPLEVNAREVTFAVTEPGRRDWEPELRRIIGKEIRCVIANPADIQRYLVEFYALARSIKASEREQNSRNSHLQNLEQLTELSRRGNLEANDQHVVGIVDWLLQYAFEQRASDIHLEPRRDTGNVRFRIDGVMHQVYQMPPKVMTAVSSRLKILGRMDLAEKRRPQDGRIKTRSPDGQEIELRLSSMPTAFGEKMVMRIFDPDSRLKNYEALGLDNAQTQTWQDLVGQQHGIVLVTGPTGSGKTTTLYSTLRQLAVAEVNVCTIEDPIELVEAQFNQMQVNSALDLNFASGVRTLLRQDPDIIMVGEIRDLETAEVAIQAALTGHLVLSTLHTNDAASAITRLMDLGVAPYLLRATLLGVMAQRLVRQLCPHCKQAGPTDADEWAALAGSALPVPATISHPVGCLECRATGFFGRLGLYEILPISNEFRSHIDDNADLTKLRSVARQKGMRSLRQAGIAKILAGQTHPREVLRATPPDLI